MATELQEFRKRYPQYNDLDDETVADNLHQSYPEIPRDEFRKRLGLPVEQAAAPDTMGDRLDRRINQVAQSDDPLASSDTSDLLEMAKDFDGPLQTYFRDWEKANDRGFLNNATRLAAERTTTLLGNASQGIGRYGEALNDKWAAGQIVFGSDWGPDDPADGKFRVRYMNQREFDDFRKDNTVENILTDTLPTTYLNKDFGGMPRNTTEEIKGAYHRGEIMGTMGAVLRFGAEQGLTSIPDMLAVLGGPAAIGGYVTARSNEIGNVRAQNKGLAEGSAKENLEALPWAVGSALLERVGAGRIVQAFGGKKTAEEVGQELLEAGYAAMAKRVAAQAGIAAVTEGATEAFQEGVLEYLGETLGTDAPTTWEEGLERGFFGALGGATFGGGAGGTLALGGEVTRALDGRIVDDILPERDTVEGESDPTQIPDTDFDADGNIVAVDPSPGSASPESVPGQPTTDPDPGPSVPRETFDPRMKRDVYRVHIAGMADELVPGGGITLIPDPENEGQFIGRTPSVNPSWFQELAGTNAEMSVRNIQEAARKALNGEPLGVREARVVGIMLDNVTGQRLEQLDHAQTQLTEARDTRARARIAAASTVDEALDVLSDYEQENAGELFEEYEYLPEMDAQARIVDELADRLDDFGEAVSEKVAIILDGSTSTESAMEALEVLLHEQLTATPGPESTATAEAVRPETREEIPAVERRSDAARREAFSRLPPAEQYELAYTDALTGLGNRRAFDEAISHAPAVASIDVDGLGPINDHISHNAGDALIQAVGSALQAQGVETYRTGGDEFYVLGDNPGEVASAIERAKVDLAHQVLEDPSGKVTGIEFTHGLGTDKASADEMMESRKKQREANGTRQPKGILPRGAVVYSSRVLNAAAGSNHVGIIGKHGDLPLTPDTEYQLGNGETVKIPEKPVRRRHIMGLLERRFGLKIYQGRVKGKTKLGFYRPGHGEIRIKNHNDLEVTAHEVSHWLDDRHPWISQLYKQYAVEMAQVSYDSSLDFEGYAEFMRTWFTQEHMARESAPGFYDAWMEALESHPGLKSITTELQQLMHAWYLQGARARLDDRFGKQDVPIRDRVRDFMNGWQDTLLQKIFDGLRPFKEAERQITGGVRTAAWSGYKSLRLARGAHGIMQGILQRGTVNWNADGDLEFTGKGIKHVFDPVSDRMEDMLSYMVARRAQELMEQGRENHIRPDEIQAGLALGEADPQLAEVFDEWQAFNDRMMDFYQSSGILSADSRAAIQEMNKNYVPFNRIMDTALGDKPKRGGGSPFMRLKGGTQDIADVMESIVGNTSHLVHMSLTNRGKENFYRMIDNADNQTAGLYAAPIAKDVKPTQIESEQVVRTVVEGLGLDMRWYRQAQTGMVTSDEELALVNMIETMASGLEPMVTFWQAGQDPQGKVDFYYDRGNKKFYEIQDDRLFEAIGQIGPKSHNLAVSILGGFANVLRRGVTITPTFQAKNFIRDTMNAFTLSKGQIVPAAAATKALLERMYNDEHYWEYMINGGGFASMADADGIKGEQVLNTHKKVWDHLDGALSAFEYANRIAEFKALRDQGWTAREAALAGREISSDFAMRGSSEALRVLTISIPFLNARLQGLYRNGRELASLEEGKVQFAGRQAYSYALRSLISITIPSLVLYALNREDERYRELPDWVRDLGWIMFTGEDEDDYVIIPKPFETGMLWGTLPERMMEYYYKNDEKELADAMLWMILETFNFDFVPQAFKTWNDLANNKNFTGAPIIPSYLENVEQSEQYRAYTSDAMIALGRKMNISPIKAEYIVRGHFGTLGSWALGMADMLAGDIANGGQNPTKRWQDNVLMAPFFNAGPLKRTHSENHLWDMLRETQQVVNTVRQIANRSPERLEQYISQPRKEILAGLNEDLVGWSRNMREIKNAIDAIQSDPDMSGDEKTRQIDALERAQNEISIAVYSNINPELVQELLDDAEQAAVRARAVGQ